MDETDIDAFLAEEPTSDEPPGLDALVSEDPVGSVVAESQVPPEVDEFLAEDDTPPAVDEFLGLDNFSGMPSQKTKDKILADGKITYEDTNMDEAWVEFHKRDPGWFEKAIQYMTIPEQFVARHAAVALENHGAISQEEAADLLSRDQVHGSDLVNVFWKNAEGGFEKFARGAVGLGVDILIDPLSYIGVGALSKTGRTAQVAGKSLKDLNKVSKSERLYYKTLEKLDTIVDKDGFITDVAEKSAIKDSLRAAVDIKDKKLGLEDLAKQIKKAAVGADEVVDQTIREGMTGKGFFKEIADGDRGLTMGIGIPFTRTGIEAEIPLMSNIFKGSFGAVDKTGRVAGKALGALGVNKVIGDITGASGFQVPYQFVRSMFLKTGKALFDDQTNKWYGSQEWTRQQLTQFLDPYRATLKTLQNTMPKDKFDGMMKDLIDEIEFSPLSFDEAFEALKVKKVKGEPDMVSMDMEKFAYLVGRDKKDIERYERLKSTPDLLKWVDDWQKLNKNMIEQYKKRGLPIEELGVGTKGWPKRYLKHMVSKEWIDYMKENKLAGDAVGSAVDFLDKKAGRADMSLKQRGYRGSIEQANEQTMEALGFKIFVDDPAELMQRRVLEMERVIQNYDLLKAAEPYLVKGQNPGSGWVKVDPSRLKRMANLETDNGFKLVDHYDLFVPDAFKTGDAYLPYDVWDRALFQINGYENGPIMETIAKGADTFMNLFRNAALFGTGYLGTNALSNTINYVMFNGGNVGAIKALGDAAAIVASKVSLDANNMVRKAKYLTGESRKIYDEAVQMNLINSDMTFQMGFQDVLENIKTSKVEKVRQGAKSLADIMYLWRMNRYVSQNTDNIFKLATYMNKRSEGFSMQASADLAEKYFYNYNNISRAQSITKDIMPFATFPMKTVEKILSEVGDGAWGSLTIPGKVEAVLTGELSDGKEVHAALDEMIPEYSKRVMHPHHGALMPGGRELLFAIPWAGATMDMLFNPQNAVHPLLQLIGLAGSYNSIDETTSPDKIKTLFNDSVVSLARMGLPSWAVAYLTGQEIKNDPGSFWTSDYRVKYPTAKQMAGMGQPATDIITQSTQVQFEMATRFGAEMDKRYGDNWLYKLFLGGGLNEEQGIVGMEQAAYRGEFIRQRMKQFTGGLASMTRLDVDFYYRYYAMQKQADSIYRKIERQVVNTGQLYELGKIEELAKQDKFNSLYPEAKEYIALKRKQNALTMYYDWVLGVQTKTEGDKIFELMFGDKDQNELNQPPNDPESYSNLFIRPEEVDDESAQIMIETVGEDVP